MNRREFFKHTLGTVAIATVAPFLPRVPIAPVPIPGTWGALERSDVAFWRNQYADGSACGALTRETFLAFCDRAKL